MPSRFRQHEKSTHERAGALCQTFAAPDCSVGPDRAIVALYRTETENAHRQRAVGARATIRMESGQLSLIVVLGLRFPCAVVTNRPEIALR